MKKLLEEATLLTKEQIECIKTIKFRNSSKIHFSSSNKSASGRWESFKD